MKVTILQPVLAAQGQRAKPLTLADYIQTLVDLLRYTDLTVDPNTTCLELSRRIR